MTDAATSPPARAQGGWSGYSIWVLFLVSMVTAFNYADRAIVAIVQEPIKHEFKLTDGDLGLLHGLAFVALYAAVGLPLARLADVRSRRVILSVIATLWSAAAAACALTGNFIQLLLARVCVGAAESGATPISLSLISDTFNLKDRSLAIAIYSAMIPLGLLGAATVGGVVAHTWGWRAAFVAVGAPGVIFSLLIGATMREPKRGQFDKFDASQPTPGFMPTLRGLLKVPTYVQFLFASGIGGAAIYGMNAFIASFYVRQHGMNLAEVGWLVGIGQGVTGFFGTLFGGLLASRWGKDNMRAFMTIPGWSLAIASITFAIAFLAGNLMLSEISLLIAYFFSGVKTGPAWAATQHLADPRARALSAAFVSLTITFVGQGLGPTSVGFLSDHFASVHFGHALGTYAALCRGGQAAAGAGPTLAQACGSSSSFGLKTAMVMATAIYFWGAIHYFLAARTAHADMTRFR